MILQRPDRLRLANLPTPVTPLRRLSAELGGPQISVKRDDLTGCALSGNKVRKLEYLLAEARAQRADAVITCGGLQSNHARATAVAARMLGMEAHLVLRGTQPEQLDGNLLLCHLVGASHELITPPQWPERQAHMLAAAERLGAQGKRSYIVPEGGSNGLGAWGYVSMLPELLDERGRLPYSHLVCALGSGGTLAGLLLGRELLGLDVEVLAVCVCDDAQHFQRRVAGIVDEFNALQGSRIRIPETRYRILEGYVGPGYGRSFPEEIACIRKLARSEGLILDPVYTGKAFTGLCDQVRQGRFGPQDHLLFLHSGGLFGLFPQRGAFTGGAPRRASP